MITPFFRTHGLTVLALILVIQAAVLIVIRLPDREEEPESLLVGLTTESATRVEIDDGSDGRIIMIREEAGWVLNEASGYPADTTRINSLLALLATARRDRPVALTEVGRRELHVVVDEYERRLQIRSRSEEHLLYIGNTAGRRGTHVRVEGEDEVWSVDGLSTWQVSVDQSAWVDPIYLRVEPEKVDSFELENSAGSFLFLREGEEWTYRDLGSGETLNTERLGIFMNRMSTLRMIRPLGIEPPGENGLAERAAVVRLELSSGKDQKADTLEVVILTQESDDDDYIVKSSNSEYYVLVSSFTLSDLVDADRSTFVISDDKGRLSSGASFQ